MDRLLVFLVGAGCGAAAGKWLNRQPADAMAWRGPVPVPARSFRAVAAVVRTRSLLRQIHALVAHADVPDPVLQEKAMAKIALMVARPDAVQLRVENGLVSLAGTARAAEIQALADGIASLRGVKEIDIRLEALTPPFTSWDDAEPGSHPPPRKPGSYPGAVSALLAAGGLVLTVFGYRLRRERGAALLAAGAALLGAGGAGMLSPRAARTGTLSHMSESSSWRPGTRGFPSAPSL